MNSEAVSHLLSVIVVVLAFEMIILGLRHGPGLIEGAWRTYGWRALDIYFLSKFQVFPFLLYSSDLETLFKKKSFLSHVCDCISLDIWFYLLVVKSLMLLWHLFVQHVDCEWRTFFFVNHLLMGPSFLVSCFYYLRHARKSIASTIHVMNQKANCSLFSIGFAVNFGRKGLKRISWRRRVSDSQLKEMALCCCCCCCVLLLLFPSILEKRTAATELFEWTRARVG